MKIFIIILVLVIFFISTLKKPEISSISTQQPSQPAETSEIHVDIEGAVVKPGLYVLDEDSYVGDLVELAGGYTDANTSCVNLAHKLSDGEKYYVPFSSEECVEEKLININTATLEELDSLPGIGEAKAQNIIDYREKNGFFETTEEIMEVDGIGEKIYNDIKDLICV